MLRRDMQSIKLKLSDLEEYKTVRMRNKTKSTAETGSSASVPVIATETATPTISETTSEIPVTQRQTEDPPVGPGWSTAVGTSSSNTNSGSTEDDTSVVAMADDNDTVAELSDEGWVDFEEDGAHGGGS